MFDFIPMQEREMENERIYFSCLHASPHVVGHVLTYHVNYGIPARQTAQLLQDIHGIPIVEAFIQQI